MGRTAEGSAEVPLATLMDLAVPLIIEQGGTVVRCNGAAAELTGASTPRELEGMPLDVLLEPADVRAAAGGQRSQATVRRLDGATVRAELLCLPLLLRGRPAQQLLVWEVQPDEPAPELTAEQLRQTQKMDAVGRLASGIAHDFNNILTAIRGHAELLLEDLPAHMSAREDALDIQRAAERAGDLTRQLLMFARGRPGEPVRLDANQAVREVEKLLRRLIRTDVGLRTDLQPDLPATMADPVQMQQVVLNLVVNASEAVDRNGLIVVRTRAVQLREPPAGTMLSPGHYVQLSVSDNGQGMDEEVRRQLFEPFFTTKPQGTGLGLSTVYGIVRKCAGAVTVRSEPGRGTTFEVLLPAAPE